MTNTQMEQKKLYQWLHMVSFAVNDITLYLDTHPEDAEALEYYRHFHKLRLEALKEYERKYGPLTLDFYSPDNTWLWSTQAMPWEGGCI